LPLVITHYANFIKPTIEKHIFESYQAFIFFSSKRYLYNILPMLTLKHKIIFIKKIILFRKSKILYKILNKRNHDNQTTVVTLNAFQEKVSVYYSTLFQIIVVVRLKGNLKSLPVKRLTVTISPMIDKHRFVRKYRAGP
jgi:hypothetical protein